MKLNLTKTFEVPDGTVLLDTPVDNSYTKKYDAWAYLECLQCVAPIKVMDDKLYFYIFLEELKLDVLVRIYQWQYIAGKCELVSTCKVTTPSHFMNEPVFKLK